jgi:hypothetical protein
MLLITASLWAEYRKSTLNNFLHTHAAFCHIICIFAMVFHRILDFKSEAGFLSGLFFFLLAEAYFPYSSLRLAKAKESFTPFQPGLGRLYYSKCRYHLIHLFLRLNLNFNG